MVEISLAKPIEEILGYKPKEPIVPDALSRNFTLPQRLVVEKQYEASPLAERHTVEIGVGQSGLTPILAPTISYALTGAGQPLR